MASHRDKNTIPKFSIITGKAMSTAQAGGAGAYSNPKQRKQSRDSADSENISNAPKQSVAYNVNSEYKGHNTLTTRLSDAKKKMGGQRDSKGFLGESSSFLQDERDRNISVRSNGVFAKSVSEKPGDNDENSLNSMNLELTDSEYAKKQYVATYEREEYRNIWTIKNIKKPFRYLARNDAFQNTMLVIITVNIITMCMEEFDFFEGEFWEEKAYTSKPGFQYRSWWNVLSFMPNWNDTYKFISCPCHIQWLMSILNSIYFTIYFAEFIIMWIGLSTREYFSSWGSFDAVMLIVMWIELLDTSGLSCAFFNSKDPKNLGGYDVVSNGLLWYRYTYVNSFFQIHEEMTKTYYVANGYSSAITLAQQSDTGSNSFRQVGNYLEL